MRLIGRHKWSGNHIKVAVKFYSSHDSLRWVGNGIRTHPYIDTEPDLTEMEAFEVDGETTISFTRRRTTNDDPSLAVDVPLDQCIHLLFATGHEKNFDAHDRYSIDYHQPTGRTLRQDTVCFPTATDCPFSSSNQEQ